MSSGGRTGRDIEAGSPGGRTRPDRTGERIRRAAASRRIRIPQDLDRLAFDGRGLIPVVAQDADGGQVLMLAWADREALERTLETGIMHYHSRSRSALWKKGETSGNVQEVMSLHADCDADTLLARVRAAGPACHTGDPSCFGVGSGPPSEPLGVNPARTGIPEVRPGSPGAASPVLAELWAVLKSRDRDRPGGSYTTRLLDDEALRMKKLGEETAELITALIRDDTTAPEEAADLLYHVLVALIGAGRSWDEVEDALRRRRDG